MKKIAFVFILYALQFYSAFSQYIPGPYAFWAHSHVVWLHSDTQNQSEMYKLVQGYKKYSIPVGGINIDAGWAQHYNDFIWNNKKFPNPQQMINNFHFDDIKVILWATSMINTDSQLYKEGVYKNYFLNHGKTIHWWLGQGAFVDFLNPQAASWFKKQMDKVLDIGFDGWKCDGADPLIIQLRPWPYSLYKKRYVGIHEYGHLFYGTFYNYTKQKNPNALIMARPVDSLQNKAYLAYAPKYVMFAGWVGDQHADFDGLKQAMGNVLHSAWKGYLNFGFDIGGYKTSSHSSKNVFIRWAQLGALVPFMQNGGGGIHQPWGYDLETINIYRKFVFLHYDLSAYFFTAGINNYQKKKSVLKPLAKKQIFIALEFPQTFGYKIDETLLVFPIFSENGMAELEFPKGSWIYYFNHSSLFVGPLKTLRVFAIDEFPLFIKANSIYPIERSYVSLPYINSSYSNLPKDQIVFVYLQQDSMNKIFNHQNFTDYLNLTLNKGQLNFGMKRYNKNASKDGIQTQMQIRVIGVNQYSNIKIFEISNSTAKNITFSIDKGDLIFSYNILNKIKIQNITFGYVEGQDQVLQQQEQNEQTSFQQQQDYLLEKQLQLQNKYKKMSTFFQQFYQKTKK